MDPSEFFQSFSKKKSEFLRDFLYSCYRNFLGVSLINIAPFLQSVLLCFSKNFFSNLQEIPSEFLWEAQPSTFPSIFFFFMILLAILRKFLLQFFQGSSRNSSRIPAGVSLRISSVFLRQNTPEFLRRILLS